MKKENSDTIQKLDIELDHTPKEKQKETMDLTNRIVKGKIFLITERVLDEWADENTCVQLNKLGIDLGSIPLDNFVDSLSNVYEAQIKNTLNGLFSRKKGENDSNSHESKKNQLLDQYLLFLEDGQLNGHLGGRGKTPDEALVSLLNFEKEALVSHLKSRLIHTDSLNRLVRSAYPDTLDLLLAELAFPDVATQALLVIGEFNRFIHGENLLIHRRQISMVVYRHALKRAAKNQVIFSGKTIARIFSDLFEMLEVDSQEWANYCKEFVKFAEKEKFLSQFIDLSEQLEKTGQVDISASILLNSTEEVRQQSKKDDLIKKDSNKKLGNVDDGYVIGNAGLVLLHPYLEIILERLGWTQNHEFVNKLAQMKSLLLTDYLVYNDREEVPEHGLILNKILCGMRLDEATNPLVTFSRQEKLIAEELLRQAIKDWTVLNNTSREGYRYSFLRRSGVLKFRNGNWHLKVDRKNYDLLMESMSYSTNIIHYPWMKTKLLVDW